MGLVSSDQRFRASRRPGHHTAKGAAAVEEHHPGPKRLERGELRATARLKVVAVVPTWAYLLHTGTMMEAQLTSPLVRLDREGSRIGVEVPDQNDGIACARRTHRVYKAGEGFGVQGFGFTGFAPLSWLRAVSDDFNQVVGDGVTTAVPARVHLQRAVVVGEEQLSSHLLFRGRR